MLKKVLAESVESRREAEIEKRQIICEKFRNTPFQQLVASSESEVIFFSSSIFYSLLKRRSNSLRCVLVFFRAMFSTKR